MQTTSISRRASNLSRRDPTSPLKHIDPVLLVCALALAFVGVIAVWSATRGPGPDYDNIFLVRQSVFVLGGAVAMAAFALVDYRKLHDWAWVFYGLTTVLLMLVITPLGSSANGAQRWFGFGPFQVQPAEFAKLSLIAVLAYLLSEFGGDIGVRRLVGLLGVTAVPMALVLVQPDLGQTLGLLTIALAMLLIGGLPTRFIVILTVVGVLGGLMAMNTPVIQEYQRDRLTAFLDPENRSNPAVYNIEQSQSAIASGQVTGHGLFEGPQTRLGYVPEQQTDFIFTTVAEQFGFVGGATVLALYGALCYRIWRTAQIARDLFGTLLCTGVLAMFVFSIFQNVGMAMGIMPITGIPLLLFSAGGSSTLVAFSCIGLVLNVHMRRFR